MSHRPTSPIRVALLFVVCGFCGCGGSRDAEFVKASNDTNIKKLVSAYQLYASRSSYRGPKSKEELVNFLKTNEKIERNLELMGLDRASVDDYFVSENDGKEFTLRWGVFVNPDLERSYEPIAFEKEGKDGIRLVMLGNRKILEIDNEKKYQRLLKGRVDRGDAKTELQSLEDEIEFE